MKRYLIAIDLHGTLLDIHWKISQSLTNALCDLFDDFDDIADFYVCTGNDSSFVEKYLPIELKHKIAGLVLESGCIVQNNSHKNYLTSAESINQIKVIEAYLKSKNYPFVKYFAIREATVSIFTSDETGGELPEQYAEIVRADLQQHEFAQNCYLTWSNVALDIIPSGVSKWSALKQIAADKTLISFMDSYNDKEVAQYSDYTFLPQNTAVALINHIRASNKLVFPISHFHFYPGAAYLCQNAYTEAVIEGLVYLKGIMN